MKKLICFSFLSVLLCALPQPGRAFVISVDVAYEVAVMTSAWDRETHHGVVVESIKLVKEVLAEYHPYWDFREQAEQAQVVFRLSVIDPDPDDSVVEAVLKFEALNSRGRSIRDWQRNWYDSIDIQYRRYPRAEKMPQVLARAFKKNFMEDTRLSFAQWIREKIPIGDSAVWADAAGDNYQLVLSIPESSYQGLEESIFRISARPEGGVKEQLEVEGLRLMMPYPKAGNETPYNGLVVKVNKREASGEKLELDESLKAVQKLGPIYLKEEKLDDFGFDAVVDEGGEL